MCVCVCVCVCVCACVCVTPTCVTMNYKPADSIKGLNGTLTVCQAVLSVRVLYRHMVIALTTDWIGCLVAVSAVECTWSHIHASHYEQCDLAFTSGPQIVRTIAVVLVPTSC